MRTWSNGKSEIREVPFDGGELHAFEVYREGHLIGTVKPGSIDDMNQCIADLDAGEDPVEEEWEDGTGNTIHCPSLEEVWNKLTDEQIDEINETWIERIKSETGRDDVSEDEIYQMFKKYVEDIDMIL